MPRDSPTMILSWSSVFPNCMNCSQPEPGVEKCRGRCAAVPAQQTDHVVGPRPAGEARDDAQLGEIDADLVEMAWVAEIVGPIVRVVHRGVDADRHVQLD